MGEVTGHRGRVTRSWGPTLKTQGPVHAVSRLTWVTRLQGECPSGRKAAPPRSEALLEGTNR